MGYIYTILKYIFYLCNLIILLAGVFLILIGVYARLNTSYISGDINTEVVNPGNYVIAFGALLLVFGLFGAVGSVREVALFLGMYIGAIGLLILIELAVVLFIFLGKEKVKEVAHASIIYLIENYRTFSDLTVVIDLIQTSLICCGGNNNIHDWDSNIYFNCTSVAISACGVPTSCCKEEFRINSQCGYYTRDFDDAPERIQYVNSLGCIQAIENLFNTEVNIFIGCLAGLFLLEIFVIAIAVYLLVDRKKKKNLTIISHDSHPNLADSHDCKQLEADWGLQSI